MRTLDPDRSCFDPCSAPSGMWLPLMRFSFPTCKVRVFNVIRITQNIQQIFHKIFNMFYFHLTKFLSEKYSLIAHIITTTQILFGHFSEHFRKHQERWLSAKPSATGTEPSLWYSFAKYLMVSTVYKVNISFVAKSRISPSTSKHLPGEQKLIFEIYSYLPPWPDWMYIFMTHMFLLPQKFIFFNIYHFTCII